MEEDEPSAHSLATVSSVIYKWLNSALDNGIAEKDFWEMTFAELARAIESKHRVAKREAQEKASYDYILADLIGRSISRLYGSTNKMPDIAEAYPTLFSKEEIQEKKKQKQAELSALRFKQFAQSYNKKFKEVAKD